MLEGHPEGQWHHIDPQLEVMSLILPEQMVQKLHNQPTKYALF